MISSSTFVEKSAENMINTIKIDDIQNIMQIYPEPTQEAVDGILFDFIDGIRIKFPKSDRSWFLNIIDEEKDFLLCATKIESNKYFILRNGNVCKYKIIIMDEQGTLIYAHTFDAENKDVIIQSAGNAVGDTIAWFPFADEFRKKYKCKLHLVMHQNYIDLLKDTYPDIHFIPKSDDTDLSAYNPYASYVLGLRGFDIPEAIKDKQQKNEELDEEEKSIVSSLENQKVSQLSVSHNFTGLHKTMGYVLNVPMVETKVRFNLKAPRQIKEPYVCIATKASGGCKHWIHPFGWFSAVKYLKEKGYRVLCIDKEPITYGPPETEVQFHIPNGCEDFTGDIPLQQRIDLLIHADMFIGLSSGLSWLAWNCNIPVILISGFTHPLNEFYTPYRIINYHVCNSCWNDYNYQFDNADFMWCPRHKGTTRQFECSKSITPKMVINAIDQCMKDHNYNPLGDSNVLENSAS